MLCRVSNLCALADVITDKPELGTVSVILTSFIQRHLYKLNDLFCALSRSVHLIPSLITRPPSPPYSPPSSLLQLSPSLAKGSI